MISFANQLLRIGVGKIIAIEQRAHQSDSRFGLM